MYDGLSGRPTAPGLAQALRDEAEGNRFFVEEAIRHLDEASAAATAEPSDAGLFAVMRLPAETKEVIGRRLARLPPVLGRTLTIASVIGRDFDIDALEQVADVQGGPLLEALEQTIAARLLSEVAGAIGRYTFRHALVREALRERLTATRRVRLRPAVGDAIEAFQGDSGAEHLTELAHHFVAATLTVGGSYPTPAALPTAVRGGVRPPSLGGRTSGPRPARPSSCARCS